MGGPSMVTKVRIGAFALDLDANEPQQKKIAERLASWDRRGDGDGIFTEKDVQQVMKKQGTWYLMK